MTSEEFRARVTLEYGDAGLHAAESVCLTDGDYDLGYDHCLDQILPALEEELIAEGTLEAGDN